MLDPSEGVRMLELLKHLKIERAWRWWSFPTTWPPSFVSPTG